MLNFEFVKKFSRLKVIGVFEFYLLDAFFSAAILREAIKLNESNWRHKINNYEIELNH